jgi:hypothetical protein
LPIREFVLSTSLQPDQVVDALHRRCEFSGASFRPLAALFEGSSISTERFELRLFGQRNHPKANVRGEISGAGSGSRIAVRVGISDPFGVIWSAGCVLGALVSLLSIRSWAQAPAGLGVATAAIALFMLHRFLSLKALDASASTAELALKDVLSAKTAVDEGVNGN